MLYLVYEAEKIEVLAVDLKLPSQLLYLVRYEFFHLAYLSRYMQMSFSDGINRSHQRLECFFKRHFSEEICDTLRLAEPCVVVGPNHDHAFKFVVLTYDSLYILANPPQLESDIELTVALQHINNIHQVHDIPEFLSGELKKNALHLVLAYFAKDSSGTLSARNSAGKLQATQERRNDELSRSPRELRKYDDSVFDDKSSIRKTILKSSILPCDDSYPNNKTTSIRFEVDEFIAPSRHRTYSDPSSNQPGTTETASHLSITDEDLGTSKNMARSSTLTKKGNVSSPRPLPPPAPGTESFNALTILSSPKPRKGIRRRKIQSERKADTGKAILETSMAHSVSDSQLMKQNYQDYGKLELQVKADLYRSLVSNKPKDITAEGKQKQNDMKNMTTPKEGVNSTRDIQDPNISNLNLSSSSLNRSISARIGSFFGKSNGRQSPNILSSSSQGNSLDVLTETKVTENFEEWKIDIYLLNADSIFIPLLRSTRMNAILKRTQEIETAKSKVFIPFNSRVLEEFYQLKADLLESDQIEQVFILTKELLSGSRKSIHLKNLFWNNAELIHYYVDTLNAYLVEPEHVMICGDKADELDYMLVIADLVINMLFNTETCPSRNKLLFGQRGNLLNKMVKISLTKPDLLKRKDKQQLSHAAAMLLAGVEKQENENEKEYELIVLLSEWADASSSLLYELFKATEQSKWVYHDARTLSTLSIIKSMENHCDIVHYLDNLIERVMQRLLHDSKTLKPSTAILLFKQLSILQYIFEYSAKLSKYIIDHYYEEFRYYIGSPAVASRIPECPLSSILLNLLSDVISAVVHKH